MSEKETRLSGLQIAESSEETNAKFENANNDDLPVVETPYTIFTKSQKLGLILLVALASIYSPLSSFIYYPALTAVANDLNTTLSKVNLTITSYMVVSGVAPMILGSIADQLGRRPVYLLVFFMYILANVGLALQTSYPALLLLRMLQSAGGSATIGLGYGVVGDITEPSERGAYMGILGCGPNVAPSLGPVLGGVLAQKAGWRWIFGFLAISGALSLVLIAVKLPETARNIVGNGSRPSIGLPCPVGNKQVHQNTFLKSRI
jgi:multidrug resistance protein